VINAIKYAFPADRSGALILVTYETAGPDWKLTVSDNGVGKSDSDGDGKKPGLGTAIVQALVKQMDAQLETTSSAVGMSVAITQATFTSHMPRAI
jgi:chemotaxis protein methyltransferase CheR